MIAPGTRLGAYEVIAQIGVGGMGEVYRATDTRLERPVAIKILPESFAHDPDRLLRFEREAKVLASLNHPNIAVIHGLEEAGGIRALVMELVEGPTLADRIEHGRLRVEEALRIAHQIAGALESAHRQGIVHRDLKPANIKLRADGTVKVLDFGLAKMLDDPAGSADISASPTITNTATRRGVLLGTAAYMAPEQARGESVDQQADVWAFGCVLFEMLSGRRVFDGRTTSDILAAIIRGAPDWTLLPRLHPRLRLLLERCFEKETARRYHTIADARVDIEAAFADPIGAASQGSVRAPGRLLPWIAAVGAIMATITGAAVWALRPSPPVRVERFAHTLAPDESFTRTTSGLVAVSPDGASIVYPANGSLVLRPLDRIAAEPIAGTGGSPTNPFFSPDGRFIGYHDFTSAELRRVPVAGGIATTLAPVTNLFGASWAANDTIVFGQEDGVWSIPAAGGTPTRLVAIAPGERVHAPRLLQDGRWLLFTLRTDVGSRGWAEAQIVLRSLAGGEQQVVATGRDAQYLPSGHLVYGVGSELYAQPFDIASGRALGAAVPVVEGVREPARFPGTTGTANYDVSADGTLVYVAADLTPPIERELVAVDRRGNATPIVAEKRDYWRPRLSPDGTRIAVEVNENGDEQLWLVDLKDGGAFSPLTFGEPGNVFAAWSHDGRSLLYRSSQAGARYGIYRQAIDGRGGPQLVHAAAEDVMPGDVSRDGVLVFAMGEQTGRRAIYVEPLAGGEPSVLLATPALEHMPAFAPDGRWIAYVSNETGRNEVYVRSYGGGEPVVRRVSQNGGTAPIWSRDGSELFYRSASGNMMAVPVRLDGGVSLGRPSELFRVQGRFRTSGNAAAYDVDAAGRFIMVTESDRQPSFARQIHIVQNWTEELKRLAPTR